MPGENEVTMSLSPLNVDHSTSSEEKDIPSVVEGSDVDARLQLRKSVQPCKE